jgi:hypothetical protein
MTDNIIFGSGVPQWSSAQVQNELVGQVSVFTEVNKGLRSRKDLSEALRDKHEWPVRHQHARGTCNAFAMVAAEELRRFIESGKNSYTQLSEEYLYDKAWRKNFTRVPEPPTGLAKEIFARQGGTYLGQVMDALIKDGLADAEDAPYDPDAAVKPPERSKVFSGLDVPKALGRIVEEDKLFHDIAQKKVDSIRQWKRDTGRASLADFFVRQLEDDKPVAAAFAILNDAEYVWTGNYARASGHVRYPTDEISDGKRPVGGHSVCLVGYERIPDGGDSNQWMFLFRNSYGTRIFAQKPDQFPGRLNTTLPGYGIISAYDVNRYCWEYLTRASPADIEALTGGRSPVFDIR